MSGASNLRSEVSTALDWGIRTEPETYMGANAGDSTGSCRGLGKAKHIDTQYHCMGARTRSPDVFQDQENRCRGHVSRCAYQTGCWREDGPSTSRYELSFPGRAAPAIVEEVRWLMCGYYFWRRRTESRIASYVQTFQESVCEPHNSVPYIHAHSYLHTWDISCDHEHMFAAFFGKHGLWLATPLSGPLMILRFRQVALLGRQACSPQTRAAATLPGWVWIMVDLWICLCCRVARVVFTMLVSRFGGFNALKCPKQFFRQKTGSHFAKKIPHG